MHAPLPGLPYLLQLMSKGMHWSIWEKKNAVVQMKVKPIMVQTAIWKYLPLKTRL